MGAVCDKLKLYLFDELAFFFNTKHKKSVTWQSIKVLLYLQRTIIFNVFITILTMEEACKINQNVQSFKYIAGMFFFLAAYASMLFSYLEKELNYLYFLSCIPKTH